MGTENRFRSFRTPQAEAYRHRHFDPRLRHIRRKGRQGGAAHHLFDRLIEIGVART
jgi:hypothetical protein